MGDDGKAQLELQPLQSTSRTSTTSTDEKQKLKYKYSFDNDNGADDGQQTLFATSRLGEEDGGGGSFPKYIRSFLQEYLFPSHLPEEVQLFRWENLAIPCCYLMVGTLQGLFKPLLNVYPLDLGATEAQQTTMSVIATLPCAFKIVYGFISDNYPLAGYRRKPYMFGGWAFASISLLWLILQSDLTLSYNEQTGLAIPPQNGAPSIQLLSLSFFLFGIGLWFADVMADALVAEKARLEPEHDRGSLQATCYSCRFFAQLVSASATSYLYSTYGPRVVIRCLVLGPLLLLPLILVLRETRHGVTKPTVEQCQEIWKTVCSRAVWQPMAFVYVFNLLNLSNAAWRQFLKTVMGFTAAQLNYLLVVSYALLYIGIITYKRFFLHSSWKRTYQVSILLNAIFSSLQLLLIRGHTFGLSPFWFALGDEAFVEFLVGIQFLPCTILMVMLCPPGSEGASYAMFTTVWNSALMLSPAISTMLLPIWDVSKEALEARQLDGLFHLTILTTLIQISPIVLVGWLLPHGRQDLLALHNDKSKSSAIGGGIFLFVLFGSMLYTLTVTILNIVKPGWAGES